MKRNARLLNKTAKRIESIPQSYQQNTFYSKSNRSPCGTVGCLAGEIIICSEPTVAKGIKKLETVIAKWNDGTRDSRWPADVAGDLVGLTNSERTNLFATVDAESWPRPFAGRFRRGRAKAAAALLRYLAQGGDV